ncbi:MAG: hypothetical protein FD123_938 [Bacteroidetes bacterium]|nr:MAG: hypothetical protein FD123_938 [Bacteroidota bacterium]
MKKIYLTLVLLPFIFSASAQNYNSQNVSLLGHFNDPTVPAEPFYGIRYQGVWGWKDTGNGNEYALIGASTGVYFINVTNPGTPVQCDFLPGCRVDCIWREIKTYDHYAYIVSDDGSPNCFQIVDLNYLPDSVHVVHQGTNIFERSHTIYVDGSKLYCGSVTTTSDYYSMAVYELSVTPENPQLIRTLDQDFVTPSTVHDMFVRNDTVYASGGYDGLHIFKFNGAAPFTQLATMTNYQEQGYNHSSYLTPDGNTLIFMDEVPAGMGVKSLDVSNFGNLTMNQIFRSTTGCTPHNPYILGANTLIAAYYQDGVQIFDISNPSAVVRTGYFDTDTLNNASNGYPDPYHGCWGAYQDLPSGNILASDMQNGLYILNITQSMSVPAAQSAVSSVSAYPNPFNENFMVNISLEKAQEITYRIYDNAGRLVFEEMQNLPAGNSLLDVTADNLAVGCYSMTISGENFKGNVKLAKVK